MRKYHEQSFKNYVMKLPFIALSLFHTSFLLTSKLLFLLLYPSFERSLLITSAQVSKENSRKVARIEVAKNLVKVGVSVEIIFQATN
ncbi:hypothetical protein HUB92_01555 [Wolbachia endosymbiont of Wiebesia pumilae]|uniref:hypothetical protein n=1 Tax=Wolbachia endosymbiont of Wiebesia pumilae TaxID=2742717 RepID=UPI001AE7E6BD|nr:hypothetical protein [Wolbachia endosymbiont of Wiebesia pumilae]QTP61646.1 hypothetical protein HUB92_01555 [Wolbachia endosymbiont of Wiebesia pumilae]